MVCFPLNDTEYDAGALGAYMATRTRGVYAAQGHYGVSAGGGMDVAVEGGVAWLKMEENWGVVASESGVTTLSLEPAHGYLARIDAVCLQLDKNENRARLVIRTGNNATEPVVAPPRRNLYYDEIYLATIRLPAGALEVTPGMITDTRLDENLCGLMRDGVTGLPTAQIQAQAEALLASIQAELEAVTSGSDVMLKSEFLPNATAAATGTELLVSSIYPKSGTDYEVCFTAPNDHGTQLVKIDGVPVTVTNMMGEALSGCWVSGVPVTLIRRGSKAFFKSGGGATKTPNVVSGTTRPQNPALNTIWVYTTVPTGKVRYGAGPPGSATSGDIWLKAGCSKMNLDLGEINWSPVAVCQYAYGGWAPKPAAWYNGSAWEPIYPVDGLLIYNRCNGSYVNEVDGTLPFSVGTDLTFFQDATAGTVGLARGSYYSNLSYTSPAFLRMKQYTMAITFKTAILTSVKCLLSVGILNNNLNVQLRINKSTPNTGGAELFGQALTSQSVIEVGPNRADSQWHSAMAVVPGQPDPAKVIVDGNQQATGAFANYPGGDSFTCCSDLATPKPTSSTVFDGAFANIMLYNRALDDYEARCLSLTMQHRVKGLI